MSTITTRTGKGSALSWAEADANFTNLNTDKTETSDFNIHVSDTTTHGVTSDIVGEDDTQTLTNKTIDTANNTITVLTSDVTGLDAALNTSSIADLRLLDGTGDNPTKVFVDGYYAAGDGGGGEFYWDATSTDIDNGGTIIKATAITTGRWKRVYSKAVDIRWFGAKRDGATDALSAFNATKAVTKNIYFGGDSSTYYFSATPEVSNGVFYGDAAITLNSGVLSVSNTVSLDWADKLTLTGSATENLTFSSVGSITGSADNWSVPITVADVGSASVGKFLRITAATGTGRPEVHEGVWEITGVASPVITVKNTANNASFPTHTLTGASVRLINTVIKSTAENVFQQYGGVVHSDKIVYQVSGASGADGTKAFAVAPRANASDNRHGLASAFFGPSTGFTGAGNHGLVVGGNAFVEVDGGAGACGNLQDGFHATENASIFAKFTIANGNTESGYMAEMASNIECDGSTSMGNGQDGFEAFGGGNIGAAQSTTIASYNLRQGFQSQDGGIIRCASSVADYNAVGMKAETGGKIFANGATVDNNTNEGIFCTKSSYVDAEDTTSTNNSTGYKCERKSLIDALGTITVSGNITDYSSSFGGDISFTGDDFFPKDLAGWINFDTSPQFEGVATPTYNSQVAEYKRIEDTVFWKIKLDYSGLDTVDVSPVVISAMPTTMAGRNGGIQLNIKSSTGISMLATDTYQANYNSSNDRVIFVDSSNTSMTYNGGKIQAAGIIEISGWYESALS